MNTVLTIIILLALFLTITIYTFYTQVLSIQKENKKAIQQKFERVKLLFNKLQIGQPLNQSDIHSYAKNPLTREPTFKLLQHFNLAFLFPDEFYTLEKAAESNLTNWLEFPTELGACPDEMQFLKKVVLAFDQGTGELFYYVYRFRMFHPHATAIKGWMLGVVGPYFSTSNPYDLPNSTFSRLNGINITTLPEEEAKWVHENIFLRIVNANEQNKRGN